ncbi:hypothetical protein SNE40_011871 [Patella caerulea]|uniref:KxDL domain-containing protein n=1 Tax=Patella caerulea TaxID=87958 RepID=A0AAN8JQY1_PATCE
MEEKEDEIEQQKDASTVFAKSLANQVNPNDVASMKVIQREMLSRFEKTNEMLINFNMLSSSRFNVTADEFQKHTAMLYDMKKDLDSVFKRIRVLKQRLGKTYPEAFSVCSDICSLSERLDDEEVPEARSSVAQPSSSTNGNRNKNDPKSITKDKT